MAVKKEEVEKNLYKLTFEVSNEDFQKAINQVYRKNAKRYNIPGFRKGHAPKAVIEKYYTEAVFYDEAINSVLPSAYEDAVKESELEIVARPEIDVEEIKKGEPVVFTALVTTKPEVKLGQYKGIEIDKIDYNVTDEDVDKEIESARAKNARMIEVEDRGIENGDIALINYKGYVDGEQFEGGTADEYELEIGSNTFIPGFEEQLIGAKVNDLVDVNVTFPEQYHSEALAGKDANFKVEIVEIRVRELPELDDDFASEVSEFETLAEYRADVQKKLEEAAENRAKADTENAVVDKVIENAEFEVPAAMVEAQIENNYRDFVRNLSYQGLNIETYTNILGTTEDALKEQFRDRSEKQINGSLVLEAVVKEEGIEVGPEELELHLTDMAKTYNMEIDKFKELISEEEMKNIEKDVAMQKAITMLVNNAVIK